MKNSRSRLLPVLAAVAALTFGAVAVPASASASNVDEAPTFAEVESDALAIFDQLTQSDDPEAAYSALSSEDLATFQSYFFVEDVTTSVTLTPLDQGDSSSSTTYSSVEAAEAAVAARAACYSGRTKYTGTSAVGVAIWDVWVEGSWCGTPGSNVTSVTFGRSWSTIAAVGWRDGGQIGSGKGITGNGLGRFWAQRKMILGVGGWDVQEARPCVRLTGYSDGYSVSGTICSVV